MNNLQTSAALNNEMNQDEFNLLDSIVEQSRIARNDEEHVRAKSLIGVIHQLKCLCEKPFKMSCF